MISCICGIQNKEVKLTDTKNRLLAATGRGREWARWVEGVKRGKLSVTDKHHRDTLHRMVIVVNDTILCI